MNEIIEARAMPLPTTSVVIRPGTLDDVDFLDALQRKTTRQVGFMPRKQFEGKVAAGHVLIAEEGRGARGEGQVGDADSATPSSSLAPCPLPLSTRVGYLIGNDQYFKRDDVGIIYQMNVVPERRRSLVAATLLQAQFARSAYGCKLYCWLLVRAGHRGEPILGIDGVRAVGVSRRRKSEEGARGEGQEKCRRPVFPRPLPLAPECSDPHLLAEADPPGG